MKIYTRTGDDGTTSLLGGNRVQKDDIRIESYGTVDELNSHVGMLKDLVVPEFHQILLGIQDRLFHIGSRLASTDKPNPSWGVQDITAADIQVLEDQMDVWEKELPVMRNFILPGGHVTVSQAHICRTVCRRAERRVITLAHGSELDAHIVKYLNRASDLFFVMARKLAQFNGVSDVTWNPSA